MEAVARGAFREPPNGPAHAGRPVQSFVQQNLAYVAVGVDPSVVAEAQLSAYHAGVQVTAETATQYVGQLMHTVTQELAATQAQAVAVEQHAQAQISAVTAGAQQHVNCLLYTSPSPRD